MSGGYKYQWSEGNLRPRKDPEREKILDEMFKPWYKKVFCWNGLLKFILLPIAIFFVSLYVRSFF
jgi:hypothetical protein